MIIELQPHHIAEIKDKIDRFPASRLNAKDLRDDIRKLLDHIEWQESEAKRIDGEWRAWARGYNAGGTGE